MIRSVIFHPALMIVALFQAGNVWGMQEIGPVQRCPCGWEFPEMLNPRYLDVLTGIPIGFTPTLEVRPVPHDAHGAPMTTPWQVHLEELTIHAQPTMNAPVIGILREGESVSGTFNLVVDTDEEWLEVSMDGLKGHISMSGLHRIHPKNLENISIHGNLPIGGEIVNRWWGIPLDYEPDDLVSLPDEYTSGSGGRDSQLRAEAARMVMAMIDAAREDGIDMRVSSPYRSGTYQQVLFGNAVSRRGLNQRGSAPPGHSEHQLGTTVDISSPSTGRFLRNSDPQHVWLRENGHRFGFRQTYTAENRAETGYIEEPWHWRYMGGDREMEWWFFQ